MTNVLRILALPLGVGVPTAALWALCRRHPAVAARIDRWCGADEPRSAREEWLG